MSKEEIGEVTAIGWPQSNLEYSRSMGYNIICFAKRPDSLFLGGIRLWDEHSAFIASQRPGNDHYQPNELCIELNRDIPNIELFKNLYGGLKRSFPVGKKAGAKAHCTPHRDHRLRTDELPNANTPHAFAINSPLLGHFQISWSKPQQSSTILRKAGALIPISIIDPHNLPQGMTEKRQLVRKQQIITRLSEELGFNFAKALRKGRAIKFNWEDLKLIPFDKHEMLICQGNINIFSRRTHLFS